MKDLRTDLSQIKQSDRNRVFNESPVNYRQHCNSRSSMFSLRTETNLWSAEAATALPWAALLSDVVMETSMTFYRCTVLLANYTRANYRRLIHYNVVFYLSLIHI